jgi:uncharacterized repeat protein (TIGR03803 family)
MVWAYGAILALIVGAAFGTDAAPTAGHYTVAYRFKGGSDGQDPVEGLIDVGGLLYGTTYRGGASGDGTVFSLDPNSGAETVVYSLGAYQGDGQYPAGALLEVDGMLFGTTSSGGSANGGTVFSLNLATGAEMIVHSFGAEFDGARPTGSLLKVNGLLFGTTQGGGSINCNGGCGTVFSLDPTTGVSTVVHAFTGANDGSDPQASLLAVGGKLYGTTKYGGAGYGVVFSLDPNTGSEEIEYAFKGGADGAYPLGSLIKDGAAIDGTTFAGGGSDQAGVVFSFTPKSGADQILYSFQGGQNDGAYPTGSLLMLDGVLFGTTSGGGDGVCRFSCGEVFSVNPGAYGEQIEHFFQSGRDGAKPAADLIKLGAELYGTTAQGGDFKNCDPGCGTIFMFKP